MNTLPLDVEAFVKNAFASQSNADGWDNLANVGFRLRQLDPSFAPQKYGFPKFVDLLKALPHLVEIKRDDSRQPPVYFGRLLLVASPASPATQTARRPQSSVRPGRFGTVPFWKYCYIPSRVTTLKELADTALPEKWHFGSTPPEGFQYPILDNYLTYTFLRLQHEGNKVLISADKKYSCFNTGLVDKRFEPIHALLAPNSYGGQQPWCLLSFCIAGEGRVGKELVSHFKNLPEPAHYLSKPLDMFYDVTAGEPKVDWRHIIMHNVDRPPSEFIKGNCPKGFAAADTRGMSEQELEDYKQRFSVAIEADSRAYRDMIRRLGDALDVALRRTRWNFKTAIPIYFPQKRNISLLLPLGVLSDDSIDLALVAERTPVGSYLGHTVLHLDWAYNDARLVCRPDSDWLTPSLINVTPTILDEFADDGNV